MSLRDERIVELARDYPSEFLHGIEIGTVFADEIIDRDIDFGVNATLIIAGAHSIGFDRSRSYTNMTHEQQGAVHSEVEVAAEEQIARRVKVGITE